MDLLISDAAAAAGIVPGFLHTRNPDILAKFSLRLSCEKIQFI